jgi:hypothetical protein
MGGPGSGSWHRWNVKRRVQECDSLDMPFLHRKGWLRPGAVRTGPVYWTYGGNPKASQLTLTADLTDPAAPCVRLAYTLSGESIGYAIRLTATRPHYGGVRWWFVCPLVVNGVPCGRRVGNVYRVGRYFGCRHCHRLTYKSRQEHDARVSRLMKDPALIRAMLDGGDFGRSFLAVKAALKLAEPPRFLGSVLEDA